MVLFSNVLKSLRKQAEASAKEVAKFLGVKDATIFSYERGDSKPSFDALIRLADFFNVSLDFLVGRSKLYYNPTGEIDYVFKGTNIVYFGKLSYTFGVVQNELHSLRWFLVVKDMEQGRFLSDAIDSTACFMFLSLVYFLREKIGFEYDAFRNNSVDLIVKVGGHYQELAIDEGYSARLYPLSYDEKIVEDWLKLSDSERIKLLLDSYTLNIEHPKM